MYHLNMDGWVEQHALDNIQHTRLRLRPLVESILGLGTLQPLRGRQPALHLERLRSGAQWFVDFIRAQVALQTAPTFDGVTYFWTDPDQSNSSESSMETRAWPNLADDHPKAPGEPST
jgi:hypothetical protein